MDNFWCTLTFFIKLAKYEIQASGWDDLLFDHQKCLEFRLLNNVLRDGNACYDLRGVGS